MSWNGSGNKSAPEAPKKTVKAPPSKWRGLAALVIVVVAGGVAAWLVMRGEKVEGGETVETKVSKISEVKPQIVTNPPAVEVEKPEAKAVRERREMLAKMTRQERLDYVQEEAIRKPLDATTTTNRAFATGTEQLMSLIFTTRRGDMPPPMPRNISLRDEAHLAEILILRNDPTEEDSERVREAKEVVQEAKEELRKFIKEGGDVHAFLEYYHSQLRQDFNERQACQREVYRVLREEPELAGEFLKEVNGRLEEKGIRPIELMPGARKKAGLE